MSENRPLSLYKPGQSGNPGGRPSGLRELRAAARGHVKGALQALVDGLESMDERIRFVSAREILVWGFGKPIPQAREGAEPISPEMQAEISVMSTDELEAVQKYQDARAKRLSAPAPPKTPG